MNTAFISVTLLTTITGLSWAAEAPRIDILGGAAFTETYITLGLSAPDAEAHTSGQDFSALQIGLSAYSISGYSSRPGKDFGGLFGAGLLVKTWAANDHNVNWTAAAPYIVLAGGGYWDPVKHLRLALLAEVGPGVAFERVSYQGNSESSWFRPVLHAGVQATGLVRVRSDLDVGLIGSYDYDRLPRVTASGPLVGLIVRWNVGAPGKPGE